MRHASPFVLCQTGSGAPKVLSDLSCLRDYLASPTPPKKSSKNAIVYSERLLEMEQVRTFYFLSAFFFETRECISFAGVSFIEMYEGPWEGRRCSVRVAEGRHIRYLGYVTVVQ